MTTPADFDNDFIDKPLVLQDYIEIVENDLDEAVDSLTETEVEQLCRSIRKKVDDILDDLEPEREPESDISAPEHERDPGDKWWDR